MNELRLKLGKLYDSFDQLQHSGDDVVKELRVEINNLELELLKEEIIPSITHLLCDLTHSLHCQIDLSCQRDEKGNVNYSFCKSGSNVLIRDSVSPSLPSSVPDTHHNYPYINGAKKNSLPDDALMASARHGQKNDSDNAVDSFDDLKERNIRIMRYTTKKIVLLGKTHGYESYLRSHGGLFSRQLFGGPGWVFSSQREKELCHFFGIELQNKEASEQLDNLDDSLRASIPALPKIKLRSPRFCITYPDGSIDCTSSNLDAYVNFLQYVGPEMLKSLNIIICGANFIATNDQIIFRYKQQYKPIGHSYYANTISTTQKKYEIMQFINQQLSLNIKIEVVDASAAYIEY